MRNLKTLIIVALSGVLIGARAQTAEPAKQDTLKLTLAQALEIGLSKSPTIMIANKEIKRVDYSNKEKIAGLLPTISASGSYQRALKKQRMFFSIPGMPANPDGIEVGQDNTFVGGFSATIPIIAPTLWASLRMNEVEMQLINESARSSQINLVNQITKSYYGVLMAQDSYDVFFRNYNNTKATTAVVADKYKLGSVSEFEWLRADVQLRNALSNTISAESAVEMSLLQLKMLMGIDLSVPVSLEGSLADYEKQLFEELMKVDASMLAKNTDLKQMDLRLDQLDKTITLQKTQWLPTLGASVNYQYMSMANDDVKFNNYVWFPTSNAALSLNIPIFQGGSKYYKYKQLQTQKDELVIQKDQLKRSLELQVRVALDNMKKQIDKIQSNKKALQQAEKSVEISKKMYQVGAATFLDEATAEMALTQAGLTYNQSIFDYVSAKADLEKILGETYNK